MRARAWAPPAASALIYTVVTAILGRDLLAQLGTAIANDPGDPLLTAAILHWNAHHVPWSEAWWQFPIYYPTRDTLAFSEHLLGLSVIASPIDWITGSPLITYNLTTLLTFPLCAMAMYALVYRLTRNAPAAFLAGLAYGFAPYRMSNLPHIQMLASFWAPLALLGLHGYLDAVRLKPDTTSDDRASDVRSVRLQADRGGVGLQVDGAHRPILSLSLYGAGWALQAAANGYMLVFFSVLVGLWVVWFVVVKRDWRSLAMIAAATAVATLPLLPILYKYATVHAHHGFERTLDEVRAYSADVAAVLCAPTALTFWGWIRVACRGEGELFPGVALAALVAIAMFYTLRRANATASLPLVWIYRALLVVASVFALIVLAVLVIGPWRVEIGFVHVSASDVDKPLLVALTAGVGALLLSLGRRALADRSSTIAFYLFAAIVTWLLALGPTITLMGEQSGRPGPFTLIQALPGVTGLRVPARFWLMTIMCLTTAAGIFLGERLRGMTRQKTALAAAALAGALLADGLIPRIVAQPLPASVPDPGALRDQVVLQLPIDPYRDIAATWRAVTGGWRTVNGYSGYGPNYYGRLLQASQQADDALFAPFQREHDLQVIVADDAEPLKTLVARQPGAVLIARSSGASQYRLPRREPLATAKGGDALPIVMVRSDCASTSVALAFDDDERSMWECRQPVASHELTIDLGTVAPVGSVEYSVGPYSWNTPSQLLIETSVDGAVWMEARRGSIIGELIAGGLREPAALRAVLPFAPRAARYVRIRPIAQPADFVWFVAELKVRRP